MKKNKNTESELLRQQAEALLKKNARKTSATLSEIDMLSLIHELEVHQIELELQNDELQRAKELADLATDKYTDLYDFAPSGYLTLSKNGDIVELNLESAKMLSSERSKLMNKRLELFVSSDTRSIFNQFLGYAFEGKRQETCEVALPNDGDLPTYALLTGILTKNNELCNVTMVDITERKQTEEELVGTKFVLDTTTDAVYWMQQDGQFVDVNDAACKKLGYTRDELLAMHVNDMNPDYPADRWPATWELIKKEKSVNIEAHHKTKDGLVFPVEIQANYVQFGDKERICSYVRDITKRKQAEAEITYQASLLGQIDSAVITIDFDNIILSWNRHAETLYQWSRDEAVGKNIIELLSPQEMKGMVGKNFEALNVDGHWEGEFNVLKKDGSTLPAHITNTYLKDIDGNNIGFIGISNDITERKQAEVKLRESEEKHRTLFETMNEGVVYQDADGKIFSANASAERILGLTFDQMQGRSSVDPRWKSIQEDGSDLPGDTHPSMVALKTGQPVSNSIMGIFHPNEEETRWININAIPQFKPGQKKPYQVYTTFQDITERKQAEETLRESEKLLRTMAENYPNSYVSIIEKDLTIGYTAGQEFKKQNLDPNQFNGMQLEQVFGENSAFVKEKYLKSFDGTETQFELFVNDQHQYYRTVPLMNQDGRITRIMVVGENITERKQTEEAKKQLETQLRQSQKLEAVGTMVGGISHELNNILQSMFLYGGLVKDELPENEDVHTNMQHLLNDGERARDIVKQVLTFSRKTNVDMKPQYLHDLILEVISFERASFSANIEIKQDIDVNCGMALCDKTQIHQILINLCNNAQHAMEEKGGVLSVSLRQLKESLSHGAPKTDVLELILSDTGHGIDAPDLEKVFDPFFTTKQFGKGTGLGLSVIHGIVEMMGGQISVTSEIGKGTTFRILFPVTAEVEADAVIKSAGNEDVSSRSILLVDDEESICSMTQIILRPEGFKVDSASDGTQALELFMANPGKYDLIVTDQSMPKMSGVELTKAIRSTNSEIPIILSTGQLGAQNEKEFKDIGITAFIQKPWTTEELIERIRGLDTL